MRIASHYNTRFKYDLSPRQNQVLELISRGYTNAEIAEALGMSLDGAKWHVSEILAKLCVSSRDEAGLYWRTNNGIRARLARAAHAIFTAPVAIKPLLGVAATLGMVGIATAVAVLAVRSFNGGDGSPALAADTSTAAATQSAATGTPESTATAPAGATSTPTTVPPLTGRIEQSPDFQSLDMLDTSQGWAIAAPKMLLRTADGGKTWHDQSPPIKRDSQTLANATFIDAAHGWVFSATDPTTGNGMNGAVLWRTVDGGATWQPNTGTIPNDLVGQLSFADAQHGFALQGLGAAAGSEAIAVLRTVDGGATWQQASLTGGGPSTSTAGAIPFGCIKNGITFVDAKTGFVTGSCAGGPPVFYVSHDAGGTWTRVDLPSLDNPSQSLTQCQCTVSTPVFATATDGFALVTGELPALYVTHDAGATWTVHASPVAQAQQAPSFADATHGWLIDTDDHLFATSDAGSMWAPITTNIELTSALIDFVSPTTGWTLVSGDSGNAKLFTTTDAGRTWSPLP